ncbi:phage head closure protein [Alkalibacillus almallahensis]|uniref:phage head closure protein n=1 Tax=Alkalibacillus almallahensis TaxID=1379154 RepID=UPI00141F90A2|nr:phage head closure protein [Alkalibacillus almallahensis]NIK10922.1 SPP1 family predicted phage head-tail adaptor [Alkalibacillus almallahensis]
MNPGELKQRLTFMQKDATDENGYPLPEPTEYAKAWGKLSTLKGDRFYEAARNNMEHNREFHIRYQKKLSDEERPIELVVYWRNKEHEIISIEDDDGLMETMTVVLRAVS